MMTSVNDSVRNEDWLFVFKSTPVEQGLTADGLDFCLVAASFDVDLKLLFVGEGVQHIMKPAVSELRSISLPSYAKTFKALADFEIEQCFVFDQSLDCLNLVNNDLAIEVMSVNSKAMRSLMMSATKVFNF